MIKSRRITLSPLLLLWLASPMLASAEGIIDLQPYVTASAIYDDNIFRLSGSREAQALLGEDKMSDTVRTLGAGINANVELGRQQFNLGLGATQVRYNHYTFQDYDGENQSLVWGWRIGSHFFGELGTSKVISQSGFTEHRSTLLNERTVWRDTFRANWEFHPRWRATAMHLQVRQENSEFTTSDRDETSDEAGLVYLTPKGSEFGLSVRRLETEYPGRAPLQVLLYGDSNQQDEVILKGRWTASGKLAMSGSISSFSREGEGPAAEEFDGINARLDANWQVTEKSSVIAAAWREHRLADDLTIGFSRARGIRLMPVWRATSKIQMQADATREEVTYLEGNREDETLKTYGISVAYVPHEKVHAQLGWKYEERETSVALDNYLSNSVNASVQVDF